MEGHLRAGLALYEAGDLKAAKTHMGHPIEEKYDAVAAPLEEMGKGALRDRIEAIARAAEAEAPLSEVTKAYDAAVAVMNEVRGGMTPADQVMGLAALTRVAGAEYTVAVKGGEVSNLHEYQDSLGLFARGRGRGAENGRKRRRCRGCRRGRKFSTTWRPPMPPSATSRARARSR